MFRPTVWVGPMIERAVNCVRGLEAREDSAQEPRGLDARADHRLDGNVGLYAA